MSELNDYEALASETGLVLPGLLGSLLATGYTVYGPEWASTRQHRCLNGLAPFCSWYDFEWLEAADARSNITEWLNPRDQGGRVFLPFGQSGAGDAYCLMPTDDRSTAAGVALIWHDDETSKIGYRSFEDFVVARYLETFADLGHHTNEFADEEAAICLKSDVWLVTQFMSAPVRDYLRTFCALPLAHREFRAAPKARPRNALSLISQQQLEIELAKLPVVQVAPFSIVPRWELSAP